MSQVKPDLPNATAWFIVTSIANGTWVLAKQICEENKFSIIAIAKWAAIINEMTIIPITDIQNIILDNNLENRDYLSAIYQEYQSQGLS